MCVCECVCCEEWIHWCTRERRGWNNHPFNSRIPADAIFIVLIDFDYSDSSCAHEMDEWWTIWLRIDTELTLFSFLTLLQVSNKVWCVLPDHTFLWCTKRKFLDKKTKRRWWWVQVAIPLCKDVFLHVWCKTWCRFVYLARLEIIPLFALAMSVVWCDLHGIERGNSLWLFL